MNNKGYSGCCIPKYTEHRKRQCTDTESAKCDNENSRNNDSVDPSDVSINALRGDSLFAAYANLQSQAMDIRFQVLQALCQHLTLSYSADTYDPTLVHVIERSLSRGTDAVQSQAAIVVPLMALRLGEAEQLATSLGRPLLRLLRDGQAALVVRANCCSALAMLHYMNCGDSDSVLQLMREMTAIFANGKLSSEPECSGLLCSAMAAWSLLLARISPRAFQLLWRKGEPELPSMQQLLKLLQSAQPEVRISAGQTIALLLENGRKLDGQFLDDSSCTLVEQFQLLLATDGQELGDMCQLKGQREIFRNLLRYVQRDEVELRVVYLGQKQLVLRTWEEQTLYALLQRTFGEGLSRHLNENTYLSSLFIW